MENRETLSVGLLFDDTLDSNDGVSQQVKRLGEYLSRHGHKVVYLCGETRLSEWSGGKVYSLSKNIQVSFNGNRLSMPLFSNKSKIRKVLQTEKLDIVHVTVPYSPLMGQRAIALAKRQNIPIVGSFHILPSGWSASFGARLLGFLQFFSLKKIMAFTSTSKNAAIFAKRTMRIRSEIVPNAIVVEGFASGRAVGNKSGRIVFLGRLVERKGCEQLLYAFKELSKSKPAAELLIAGDGPQRNKLERLAGELKISDRVNFLGHIKEADKPRVLGSAQIACFPALHGESFGVVLVEAMAAGAGVVVGGNNPGYQSVLGARPELLIDPRDSKHFAKKLADLMSDRRLAQDIHRWQSRAVKEYDVDVVGRQIVRLYRAVIAKQSIPGA